MFSFFNKKIQPDLSFLGADMHSHLLPAIDDGLKNVEQSVTFIKELNALGYNKFICTPHILSGVHNNTPDTILPALEKVRNALAAENVQVVVEAAAEYMIDDFFEEMIRSNRPLLTLGGDKILIEMSYAAPSPNLYEVIFALQLKNLKPIFAHPERYEYYHSNFEQYYDIKNRDIFFQVNLLSLSGYYGKQVKKIGERLIREGMVEFIGTDMHHAEHLRATKEFTSSKEFYDILKDVPLLNKTL